MPIEKRWVVKPQGDSEAVAKLAAVLRISPVLANLLVQRGIDTVEKADKFFKPSLADLHDPFLMKDMDKAVERVEQAVRNNEKIMVYGDYDVDGCTAVALVYKFLRQIGHKNLMFYIPDRYTEGYGISIKGIDLAARKGVDVRLIYDGFGSMFTLPGDYDEEIRRAGIKCHVFNPLHFSLHISDYKMLNHRDHRKITVVDGETAFTGGLNFADEYINRKQRCGVWKDTGLMLKGPGVYPLTVTFLKMWDFVAGTTTPYTDYMPLGEYEADGYVQPYCDSPLDGEAVAESAYLNVLQHARDYVYIVTPYLIVDNEMVTALCLAAKSGVDVRILTPGVPDKWYVYYVTQSYYPRLLEAGVRIYEYTPGFVHAKMYVSDDREAIVGSANMDYRSLYLHFENCCAFYGGHMVRDVLEDVRATLAESHEVTMADVLRTPLYKWLAQVFLRFFSPLM